MLSLFCYILGDDPNDIFPVEIDSSKSIGNLKDVIKAKKSPTFNNISADKLRLWKVSIAADDVFENSIDGNNFEDTTSLRPTNKLSRVFPEPLLDDHIHIVVRSPEGPFTSNIHFHDDDFCRKVFRSLWRRREDQTCIHERDGFKYLDLRKLELKFGERTQLLIRKEYIRLASEAEEVYEKYLNSPSELRPGGIVVTGQPGIGKTLFLQWLLLERLLDGKRTILRTKNDYAYFSANGFIRISEMALPPFPDIWLLADPLFGGNTPPMETGLFTIFTTSPSEKRYKEWRKQNLAKLFIMNPWTWEELNFVGSSLYDKGSIDLEKLATAFNLYGPTARNPLEYATNNTEQADLESAVERAISGVECTTLQQLTNQQGPPDVSSKILCMSADDRGMPLFRIISTHVAKKLYVSLRSRQRDKLVEWFHLFSNIPETGSAAGWIWEGYCHRTLPTLSSLQITSLDDKKMETLRLVPSRQVDFQVLREIPKKPSPGYYAPVTRNNVTFDAFSVTNNNQIVVMQFTVSSDHSPPKGEGLDALADVLSQDLRPFKGCSWLFIWIVPKGRVDSITAKLPTEGNRKAWQNQGTIKQYVATLEFN